MTQLALKLVPKAPKAKKSGQPLEARDSKVIDSPLELPEIHTACQTS